eukprot:CAMPEP_0176496534 /NCGR_PEP_ID=MMETSP0200_2-20121128/11244_1 /TAXON_ID=947934 /ORGANISM="Chaetoceros sp., Strain GSL56" /LENGTH=724 /DNA_ID=CAMNT_0017894491 /DNA_START=1078 /DNA_END=3252 /DNA_ORIENTATION=-
MRSPPPSTQLSAVTVSSNEDNSIEKYSRCLTPSQERDQINEELGFKVDSRWKKAAKKPVKFVGKTIRRTLEGTKSPGTLILVRGGESEFSRNFTFTGWSDPPLTSQGELEMEHAGRLLLESGYEPDVIYTSRLKRAIKSAWVIMQEINAPFLPIYKSWRLNERHYGALQGLCKKETAKTFGADVVQAWRRSLKARPPAVKETDANFPGNDRKFADLVPEQIPRSESLLDCMRRTEPLWDFIKRDLIKGENVMVVAHANTLRGLAKIIDGIGDEEIADVSFPKGIPVVYKFDNKMEPLLPNDKGLTQIHTSGQFLEKPGLLKKALDTTKEWEASVPGTMGYNLPNVAKRMSTMENALLYLKEEQKMWKGATSTSRDDKMDEVDRGNNDGEILLSGSTSVKNDTMGVNDDDERFEEMTHEVKSMENVSVNLNSLGANDLFIVLIRHGRTPHNKLALFTGWEDPPLAMEGEEDARWAGRLLKKHGFQFDVVYTSWLYRAIQTAWFVLEEMDQLWLPVISSWRLNERHYGDLTGKSKKMVANIYGEDQLKRWRRGYKIRPPPVSSYSFSYPGNDKRRIKYVKDIRISFTETFCRSIEDRKLSIHRKFPKCESLFDCMNRSIPFYTEKIVPEAVAKGKRVLITSHENAIRGILMHLCEIPEECMNDLHLPNGVPLVYNVKRKCISLLDDGTGEDPLEKYDFGSAAQYLFRPCEIGEDEDWYTGPPQQSS